MSSQDQREDLTDSIELLRRQGIKSVITPIIRHGLVVEEVLDELNDEEYDLLGLGSHQQPSMTRWRDFLLNDVTDELLHKAPISTLVIYRQIGHDELPE